MQSTALVLMNCENAMRLLVPVYDYIIFCDLGLEPPWVSEQVEFVENICQKAGTGCQARLTVVSGFRTEFR